MRSEYAAAGRRGGIPAWDLDAAADAIYRAGFFEIVSAWADDTGTIFCGPALAESKIPAHWIIGTFTGGVHLSDVRDDLAAMSLSRSKDWIVDGTCVRPAGGQDRRVP